MSFLSLLGQSYPLYCPFLSIGKLCQRSPRTFPVSLLCVGSTRRRATALAIGHMRPKGVGGGAPPWDPPPFSKELWATGITGSAGQRGRRPPPSSGAPSGWGPGTPGSHPCTAEAVLRGTEAVPFGVAPACVGPTAPKALVRPVALGTACVCVCGGGRGWLVFCGALGPGCANREACPSRVRNECQRPGVTRQRLGVKYQRLGAKYRCGRGTPG